MILTLFLFSVQVHPSISYFYSTWYCYVPPTRFCYFFLVRKQSAATTTVVSTVATSICPTTSPVATAVAIERGVLCSCAIDYESGGICRCISYWFQIHHMMIITMMITTEMIQLIPSNDANTVFHFKFCCCCSSIVQPTVNPNDDWVHILNLFLLIIITILLICFLYIPWSTFYDDDTTAIATTGYYCCYRSFQCLLRFKSLPSILQVYYLC